MCAFEKGLAQNDLDQETQALVNVDFPTRIKD